MIRELICAAVGLAIAGVATPAANAETTCAGKICVRTVQTNRGVTFYGINRNQALPVTLSIALTLKNMHIVKGSNAPVVVNGGEKRWLMQLRPRRRGAWRWSYRFRWVRGDNTAKHYDSHVYRLPYRNGEAYRISQGCHGAFSHKDGEKFAIDFSMAEGTVIVAARGGVVVEATQDSNSGGPTEEFSEQANRVVIQHDDRTLGIYGHLKFQGALVKVGETVRAGDQIGLSGNTGFSTEPHLHFMVSRGSEKDEMSLPVIFATEDDTIVCPAQGLVLTASEPLTMSVREAQEALTSLGYDPGPIDGVMGGRTRNAVSVFQEDAGLSADGKITESLTKTLRQKLAAQEQ